MNQRVLPPVLRKPALQVGVLLVLALLVGNVNALVDSVIHPEIPYFDQEHLIVGGVTTLFSAGISFLLLRFARHLDRAESTIHRLEALLPICSNCRKIRRAGADPYDMSSWQPIESYITEKTTTKFSHGICPDCMTELYPDFVGTQQSERERGIEG